MAKSKQFTIILVWMAFSVGYSSQCHGQNIANNIMSLFIKDYYQASRTTFSGFKYGYNLNDYDTIVCNPNIYRFDTCNSRHDFVMNHDLFAMFDSLKIKHPIIRFEQKKDKTKPYIILKDLKCVRHGYVFEISIIIQQSNFYAQYYYSNWTGKLIQIEDIVHLIRE